MKTYLLSLILLFIALLGASAQSNPVDPDCVVEDECFEFTYKGPTVNSDGTITLNFSVKINCDKDLSYAAFELPAGARASAYSPKIKVENPTNNPFYSIKFEMKDGYKDGATVDFSYTITAEEFASLTTIRVQAKAGEFIGYAIFDADGCGENPDCVLVTEDFTFTFMQATTSGDNTTVTFLIANNSSNIIDFVSIAVPEGVAPTDASAPGFDPLIIDNFIFYSNSSSSSTAATFSFTIPTSSYTSTPIYELSAEAADASSSTIIFNTDNCTGREVPTEPLPVTLLSFQGKATSSGIELTWTTASEKNNDRFDVQRSTDGKEFSTIGKVKGAGNSLTPLSYSFTDNAPAKGINYYRLQQVDTNGTSEFSNTIAHENIGTSATSSITVYPNPVTGNNISIILNQNSLNSDKVEVIISDINGRKVLERHLTATQNELQLSLDQLKISKGLYLIRVQGKQFIQTQRLLIK